MSKFNIGSKVKLVADGWYSNGLDLKGLILTVVPNRDDTNYYICERELTVELEAINCRPDEFVEVVDNGAPILQLIEATSKRVGTGDTQAILLSLMEEVGELATEINIENGTKKRAASEDGVEGEAVDVLIVICDLIASLYGSLDSALLRDTVQRKLAKWESK
ncbi:hypothetical protein vBPFY1MI_76 [Pseudomonas phage vB_PF_Y1-MI]|nr:hypothetical protein vBPFY1MI_76 [Pseudomonas phage vB_PF_Y1-MI]